MSMPVISPSTTTRCQAISDIIGSVALEQAAISHILNAEGEKLQRVVTMPSVTIPQLIEVNNSVENLVDAIAKLELILQSKLKLFGDCSYSCEVNE
jgi:hypothetical protein